MINQIVTKVAKREFSRSLKFEDGSLPELPFCTDNKQRLLYIHIPFCEELCPYCSFHRITFEEPLTRKYFQALRREIKIYHEKGYKFEGIYVGGGTPTVLIGELAETLNLARDLFPIKDISVETNPNHLTLENIEVLRKSKVKRLSVGVQTFNDDLLKKIGRYEKYGSGAEIAERLKNTQGAFHTLNADMIFNFPGQTIQMLEDDLVMILKLNMDQVTFYPLMISDLTREIMKNTFGNADFSGEEKFYKLIVRRLEKNYDFSSAWCFSRKESLVDEYVVEFEEYAGLGSGAIGYLYGTCYSNTFDIEAYMASLEKGRLPLQASRKFDLHDQMNYDFLMKLFSTRLDIEAMQKKYDGKFLKTMWKEIAAFEIVRAYRYFPPYLHLTPYGRYLWVIMMREFFIAVNNFRDYCRKQVKIG
ncbi:MAG TPA: coproporphyrinogen III oxidase family protein [Smithella sp.]|nr:coproporphyrinogen III oxidase family protein [Smithella sp.]MDM7986739.1 coproporphyrinogen III oxidase family protein [Smithella sp.]HNY50904.1 coproporphyrinogen III oxidase family protein [Smithella sp.]HOG90886.1 coproporphyrinogen III oxidase family protein [Smithella sp.]HQG64211.1 coproporphyrinogen III oxidase family protein [Smithella sp.]